MSGFPSSVSVAELGGIGDDTLTGGEESEDMLVDGPGDDVLSSLGADDILNNGGADQLSAGDGNDLFLSNSICEGDVLNGGEGRDNPSWAKFKAGVEARIGAGDAGRPGPGGAPECAGGTLDSLQQDEDLEGTGSADVLRGGPESNQLLGHAGEDSYFAEAGDDTILANSGDFDPTIDCGADDDLAVIDLATQIGDGRARLRVGAGSSAEQLPGRSRIAAGDPATTAAARKAGAAVKPLPARRGSAMTGATASPRSTSMCPAPVESPFWARGFGPSRATSGPGPWTWSCGPCSGWRGPWRDAGGRRSSSRSASSPTGAPRAASAGR